MDEEERAKLHTELGALYDSLANMRTAIRQAEARHQQQSAEYRERIGRFTGRAQEIERILAHDRAQPTRP